MSAIDEPERLSAKSLSMDLGREGRSRTAGVRRTARPERDWQPQPLCLAVHDAGPAVSIAAA